MPGAVQGPIDPSHLQGQLPIHEKRKEAGVLDVLSQVGANDIMAFLQAAGLTKTQAEEVLNTNSTIVSSKDGGVSPQGEVGKPDHPNLPPVSKESEGVFTAALKDAPPGEGAHQPTVGDKRAAAWLSGSYAAVQLTFLLLLMKMASMIKQTDALSGAESTVRSADITAAGAQAIVDVSKEEAHKHIIQRNAAIARAAIAFASFVGQTILKPIAAFVMSKVKSLCSQAFQKVKGACMTAYNKVQYEMSKQKFNEADSKAKSLEADPKFNEDSPEGQAVRDQHADACKTRDAAFEKMEKYAVKSGNGDDFKKFAAANRADESKTNPAFSQEKCNDKLANATQANNFRNSAKDMTAEQKQERMDNISPDLKDSNGNPASAQEKIAHNEENLNQAHAEKQAAMEQGAHGAAVVAERDALKGERGAIKEQLKADKELPEGAEGKLSQTERQELQAKLDTSDNKMKELDSRVKNNHYEDDGKGGPGTISQAKETIAKADARIEKAESNLNSLHAMNDTDEQFGRYMSGKENAIFGDPRPGSDQIAGIAGSKAYADYTESKIPPGSTPEQQKTIREQAGNDLQKQKDLRLDESAKSQEAFNARVDKGVAEHKADRKAAMDKAKESSYEKELHTLTNSARTAEEFGQNLTTAVEHTLLAQAELALGHLKASEHVLRELAGNMRNWTDKTHESYREACDLIKNIIDAMVKIMEAEKQRGFGKTYTS